MIPPEATHESKSHTKPLYIEHAEGPWERPFDSFWEKIFSQAGSDGPRLQNVWLR